MSRSLVKLIGLTLLVPALALSFAPLVAAHTDVLNSVGAFNLAAGKQAIFELRQTPTGALAVTWPGVWAIAALGELILITLHLVSPPARSNKLSIRG